MKTWKVKLDIKIKFDTPNVYSACIIGKIKIWHNRQMKRNLPPNLKWSKMIAGKLRQRRCTRDGQIIDARGAGASERQWERTLRERPGMSPDRLRFADSREPQTLCAMTKIRCAFQRQKPKPVSSQGQMDPPPHSRVSSLSLVPHTTNSNIFTNHSNIK